MEPDAQPTTSDSDRQGRGLTKRGRLVVIVAVALLLVGGSVAFRAFAVHTADDDLAAALRRASAAAPQLDQQALWRAEVEQRSSGVPSMYLPGIPTFPHAQLIRRSVELHNSVLVYEIDTWGQRRCFELTATATGSSASSISCHDPVSLG